MDLLDGTQIRTRFAAATSGDYDAYSAIKAEFSAWFATLPADKAVIRLWPADEGRTIECEYVTLVGPQEPEVEWYVDDDGLDRRRPLLRQTTLAVDPPMPPVVLAALTRA